MTHTPGPWKYGRGQDTTLRIYKGTRVIAQFGEGIDEDWAEHKNAEANARLIAAAPELLAACKAVALYFDEHPGILLNGDEKLIRSAIARATGQ